MCHFFSLSLTTLLWLFTSHWVISVILFSLRRKRFNRTHSLCRYLRFFIWSGKCTQVLQWANAYSDLEFPNWGLFSSLIHVNANLQGPSDKPCSLYDTIESRNSPDRQMVRELNLQRWPRRAPGGAVAPPGGYRKNISLLLSI